MENHQTIPSLNQVALKDITSRSSATMENQFETLSLETFQLDDPFPAICLDSDVLNNANCKQNVVRSTLTRIPRNRDVLLKSGLPQALFFQPFYSAPLEMPDSIAFCCKCYSYINPFVEFTAVDRWRCKFCGHTNRLDETNENQQLNKAPKTISGPEMANTSIDFPTPTSLVTKKPRPTFLYLLDTSSEALATGYLPLFCNILLSDLNNKTWDPGAKIGFITYDREVHLYRRARQINEQLYQLTVPDLENIQEMVDAIKGHSSDYLHNIVTYKESIIKFLKELPSLFQSSSQTEKQSALGAAMILGTRLASYYGGRMTIFQVSKPNIGQGKLQDLSKKNGCLGYEATNKVYGEIGIRCCEQGIAIDIFFLGREFMGLATLADAPKHSGGITYRFADFQSNDPCQKRRFKRTFRHYLTRDIGWNSEIEIHLHPGFRISKLFGSRTCTPSNKPRIELPVLHPDASFGFEVILEKNIPAAVNQVCFQVTLDYMTNEGQYRTRVHTVAIPVTNSWVDVFKSIDQQCLTAYFAKMVAKDVVSESSNRRSIDTIRERLNRSTTSIIKDYEAALASQDSSNHINRDKKSMIRHLMALINSNLLILSSKNQTLQSEDDYAFIVEQWRSLPVPKLIPFLLPRLFLLHQSDTLSEPVRLKATLQAVQSNGAYLMDTEEMIYLYIGRDVSTRYLYNTLDVSSYNQVTETLKELPVLPTPQSETLRNFISQLQSSRHPKAMFQVVKDNGLLEGEIKSKLSPNVDASLLYNC